MEPKSVFSSINTYVFMYIILVIFYKQDINIYVKLDILQIHTYVYTHLGMNPKCVYTCVKSIVIYIRYIFIIDHGR